MNKGPTREEREETARHYASITDADGFYIPVSERPRAKEAQALLTDAHWKLLERANFGYRPDGGWTRISEISTRTCKVEALELLRVAGYLDTCIARGQYNITDAGREVLKRRYQEQQEQAE